MKPAAFSYTAPDNLEEALALLAADEDARVLAGGQSLVPIMNFRLAEPSLLIDLNRIAALEGIDLRDDGSVRMGAMTRHSTAEKSAMLRDRLPLVSAAVPYIAHTQIRNRGTIGGSLAHADPSAEWPALCLALDASMTIASPAGVRSVPAVEFSLGILTTAIEPGEILVEIIFPSRYAHYRWGFQEVSRRHGDFAIVGVACVVAVDGEGVVGDCRIVIFGADDMPILSEPAALAIHGQVLNLTSASRAGEAAAAAMMPRSDFHASSEYRSELIVALTRRALLQAANQTQIEIAYD